MNYVKNYNSFNTRKSAVKLPYFCRPHSAQQPQLLNSLTKYTSLILAAFQNSVSQLNMSF